MKNDYAEASSLVKDEARDVQSEMDETRMEEEADNYENRAEGWMSEPSEGLPPILE